MAYPYRVPLWPDVSKIRRRPPSPTFQLFPCIPHFVLSSSYFFLLDQGNTNGDEKKGEKGSIANFCTRCPIRGLDRGTR